MSGLLSSRKHVFSVSKTMEKQILRSKGTILRMISAKESGTVLVAVNVISFLRFFLRVRCTYLVALTFLL